MFIQTITQLPAASATVSAMISAVAPSATQTPDLWTQIKENVIPFLTLVTMVGGFFGVVKLLLELGKFYKSFDNLTESVKKLNPVVTRLNSCVQEIQSVMKNKYKTLTLIQETLDLYGVAHSPIILKDEYRHYIEESGLIEQIEDQKAELTKWLAEQKPVTGLDAQEQLIDFVLSGTVDTYLDTRELKTLLYKAGKTLKDYYLILSLYLFEVIIPEVVQDTKSIKE